MRLCTAVLVALSCAACGSECGERHAYATLVFGEDSAGVVAGTVALGASLRRYSASRARRVGLVAADVPPASREAMRRESWEVREVADVRCTATEQALRVRRPGALDSFARTCTKLHAFNLTEFERVVLLLSLIHI